MTDTAPKPILSALDITRIGQGLDRPESVHVTDGGDLLVSHRARGISRISPDGHVETLGRQRSPDQCANRATVVGDQDLRLLHGTLPQCRRDKRQSLT